MTQAKQSPPHTRRLRRAARAMRAAFPHTVPVLAGFAFLGAAYGMLMNSKGYDVGWTTLMSLLVFAGSAQYMAVSLLTSAFNPLLALALTLVINARHLFYGLAMLDRFRDTGRLRPYLIFALCDETFSILSVTDPPRGVDRRWFLFFVALLNHAYWVASSAAGALLGAALPAVPEGLDFVLTALFAVIFIDQWKRQKSSAPALIGLTASAAALLMFGPDRFILPAMAGLAAGLWLWRKKAGGTKEARP